ncbi:hypothetical protein D9619_004144 [Psilocybe cf. subviscida]|uniref:Uncharacterized protein n=1 Tax=Psilocybe cf. subviscida TaxID=2480587 RepID=A0A8H5BP10_9AGAR|nr:hypothetical protein D9619_004144 [Psilocybe cf. subviscida]
MQRSNSNSTDKDSIKTDDYPFAGFAGDEATAHAHRAAKLISEYLELTPAAKTRLQKFIQKMLYYKSYNLDDLCTATAVVQKLAQVPCFRDFREDMAHGTAISNGTHRLNNADEFPVLLFSGAYSLAESLNSPGVCSDDYASKLVLDTKAFSPQEIANMAKELYRWFDCNLEVSSAELDSVKAVLISN